MVREAVKSVSLTDRQHCGDGDVKDKGDNGYGSGLWSSEYASCCRRTDNVISMITPFVTAFAGSTVGLASLKQSRERGRRSIRTQMVTNA